MVLAPPPTQKGPEEVESKWIAALKRALPHPHLKIKKDDYQGFPPSLAWRPICSIIPWLTLGTPTYCHGSKAVLSRPTCYSDSQQVLPSLSARAGPLSPPSTPSKKFRRMCLGGVKQINKLFSPKILFSLWLKTPNKISEPYNNHFCEKERKKRRY